MMFVLIQPEAKLLLFPTQNYFLTCFALLAVAIVGTQIGELQKENLEKVEPQLLHNWPAALCLPPGCRKTFKLWKLKQNSLSDTHNLHLLTAALVWNENEMSGDDESAKKKQFSSHQKIIVQWKITSKLASLFEKNLDFSLWGLFHKLPTM